MPRVIFQSRDETDGLVRAEMAVEETISPNAARELLRIDEVIFPDQPRDQVPAS